MSTRFRGTAKSNLAGLIVVGLLAAPAASASVTYQFDFTDVIGQITYPDFSFSLTYDNYVTTTGLTDLAGPALQTPLGFSVIRAGTNSSGLWGFDGGNTAILTDGFFQFDLTSFDFRTGLGSYITSPGIYTGSGLGNGVPSGFRLDGTLTVTSTVPEPSTLSLAGLALVGIGWIRRKWVGRRGLGLP